MRSIYRGHLRPLSPPASRAQRLAKTPAALHPGSSGLGPLETRLLELLWAQDRATTVRELRNAFPALAYTTIMTTVERLYRKGLLRRHQDGRAFAYQPRCTRDELLSELMSGHVTDLLGASQESTFILSTLVRAVGRTDAALLEKLDALVRAERLRLRQEDK